MTHFIEKQENPQSTAYWFCVENDVFGLCERKGETSIIDEDGFLYWGEKLGYLRKNLIVTDLMRDSRPRYYGRINV